jgi:hypothetical protein
MGKAKARDVEKERRWKRIFREAARSGLSIRAFCRREKLAESQFYWWQRELKKRGQGVKKARRSGKTSRGSGEPASFALVSQDGEEAIAAGIELVLADGRRLRIGKGVDEETLSTVLGALETAEC